MSDIEMLEGSITGSCDKCGEAVELKDDVIALILLQTGNPAYGLAFSRHILPVEKDGEVICVGSPSRAQYLEGQPRDTRTAYPYYPEMESIMRTAYERLQRAAALLNG